MTDGGVVANNPAESGANSPTQLSKSSQNSTAVLIYTIEGC